MENLHPRIGDRVHVRQRMWVVRDVDAHGSCRLVTLTGHSPEGQPHTWQVLHPFDDIEPVAAAQRPRHVSARAWRRACVALLSEHAGCAALHAAAPALLELLPYQLEPALALVSGLGSRILIADDVGLGKTLQALLCAAEMRARGFGSRVLVLCPAGLRDQWVEEAATRLHLPLTLMDQPSLRRLASTRPVEVNPWTIEPCVVSSIDFVKRPEVLPSVMSAGWDLVVVDEAHGCCGPSERHDAVSALARRAPFVLLLSATPHSGDEAAFAALCDLGALDDNLLVFRRSRQDAGHNAGRRVHTTRVIPTGPERRMHAALAALTRAVHRERRDLDPHVWLMLSLLHKRALSSPHALAASAERRLRLVQDAGETTAAQLLLPWMDDTGDDLESADAAPMWEAPALQDLEQERRLLQQVVDAARQAEGLECKLRRLRRLLQVIREPVIVFTEYRDTLQHVRTQVAPGAALIHGGLTREQRRAALEAFPSAGVLLATDAAGEGLNLQAHCRTVINLELPWNPMRLEQRIGRVDRIGQRHRVHVFHLVAEGTGEARLLARLSARLRHAAARVGAPDPLSGRPAWTEEASARLVVLRQDVPPVPEPPPMQMPRVRLTRLETEGQQEAARLSLVRALAHAPAESIRQGRASLCPGTGPRARVRPASMFIARTTRRRLRAVLRGRTLRVFRSRVVDAAGRTVATHVSGTLSVDDEARRADADRQAQACIGGEAARTEWLTSALEVHGRVSTVRADRARAIAALFDASRGEQQPGLFDRRVERRWQEHTAERQDARAMADARLVRIDTAAQVSVTPPELVLVLGPSRGPIERP